jgi:hypothetical protein
VEIVVGLGATKPVLVDLVVLQADLCTAGKTV